MEANADLLVRLVDQRPYVNIGGEPVATQDLDGDGTQLVDRMGEGHVQHACVATHALEVLRQAKHVEPPLLCAPVRANALEAPGAVVERVGEQAQVGVAVAAQLPVEVHPIVGLGTPFQWSDQRLSHRS